MNVLRQDLEHIDRQFINRKRIEEATIVVTGGAGFLGYELVHYLVNADGLDVRVVVYDNLLRGSHEWLDALVRQHKNLELRNGDVTKPSWAAELRQIDPTYIIHMASVASPVFYRQYPLETVDANIWGLRHVLDTCVDASLQGLLFFSSSEIYGDPEPGAIPTPESYPGRVSSLGPRACYDESKRFGETLCEIFARTKNVPARVVRPFNNYGPGMRLDDGRIPADLARAILDNKDIRLYSDGTPTRSFCYVADALAGYLSALVHDRFDVFNIGNDEDEVTMARFAETFADQGRVLCGYEGEVTKAISDDGEYLTNNPSRRMPDIRKARQVLGYAPSISMEEGIGRFLRHLLEQRGAILC